MRFEGEGLDKEMIDRLISHGIWLRNNAPKITKEQALLLIGETMLDKFVIEFTSLWKNELFASCLLKDYEASAEEVHEWIHGGDPQPDCKLCSKNCKGVMKMEANIQAKLDSYLELLNALKAKTSNELTAVSILQEISKDARTEQIREEREAKNIEPATEKQKKFMKKLGMDCPKNATKQEASAMIDEELSRNGNGE